MKKILILMSIFSLNMIIGDYGDGERPNDYKRKTKKIPDYKKQFFLVKAQLDKANQELKKAQQSKADADKQLEDIKDQLAKADQDVTNTKVQDQAQVQLDKANQDLEAAQQSKAAANKQLEDIKAQLAKADQDVTDTKAQAQAQLAKANQELEAAQQSKAAADKQLEDVKAQAQAQLAKADQELETAKIPLNQLLIITIKYGLSDNPGYISLAKSIINLLKKDINYQSPSSGYSALEWAARYGELDLVKTLLSFNATVNLKDTLGNTALIWARDYTAASSRKNISLTSSEKNTKQAIEQLLINAGAK